jgi:arylsulfatase A-like enzyme
VTTALCAPSRGSILTGQYAHNHRLIYNAPPDGGFPSFHGDASTIAVWLKAGGYRTALLGKYLNGYPHGAAQTYVPPGWDEWFGHRPRGRPVLQLLDQRQRQRLPVRLAARRVQH